MKRFFIGLLLGIVLTAQALIFAAVGHCSYAPLVFVASIIGLIPILGLFAGPLLWAFYFLIIPNLETSRSKTLIICLILLLHLLPGFWIASQDPALTRASLSTVLIFAVSFVVAIGLLLFFSLRRVVKAD